MSPWSAAAVACLASSALAHRSRRLDAAADVMVVAAAVVLQLVVGGYLYDVVSLYGVDRSIRVSGQTLLAMSALWVALVVARVAHGSFETTTRPTVGGTAARWLLPRLLRPGPAPRRAAPRRAARRLDLIRRDGRRGVRPRPDAGARRGRYPFARHLDVVERRYIAERRRRGELARLLAIYAWTGRVRWNGEWVRVERFLKERFGVVVTHTISDEALETRERELDQPFPPNGAR